MTNPYKTPTPEIRFPQSQPKVLHFVQLLIAIFGFAASGIVLWNMWGLR